jgi:hypothetical protein
MGHSLMCVFIGIIVNLAFEKQVLVGGVVITMAIGLSAGVAAKII